MVAKLFAKLFARGSKQFPALRFRGRYKHSLLLDAAIIISQKVALTPTYRIFFLTLPKVASYDAYQQLIIGSF